MTRLPAVVLAAGVLALQPSALRAAPSVSEEDVTVVVVGIVPRDLDSLPGSAAVVEAERLRRMNPPSAKEALRIIPGVAVVEEDALGLKLNVSVRGLTPRRSSRTLLLEDGVPIQPAPYADPSAHYYPVLDRVESIEVRRGSVQIPYGPQSVGGVINFVTRAAPTAPERIARLEGGNRGYRSVHGALGTGNGTSGIGVAATHKATDGIREQHGTRLDEVVLRARLQPADAHVVDVKLAHYTEDTRLTEGGLDQARYSRDPYDNPFPSDRFRLEREAAQVTHQWRLSDAARLTTQAYAARMFRASYRQADTSVDTMVANPATGCVGSARRDYEGFASRCGNKMRPRRFAFHGVGTRLDAQMTALGGWVDLATGVRFHREDTDRKRYDGLFPDARETSVGTRLRDHNRIDVDAVSAFLQASWQRGALSVTPGLRVEDVRVMNTALSAGFQPILRSAAYRETTFLPGLGATLRLGPGLAVFAGVHRGFAPPRPDRDFDPNVAFNAVRPEKSVEAEVGLRGTPLPAATLQAVLFDMHLDDLIVEGSLVGGRSGSFVNAGEARHRGLEIGAGWESAPLRLALAYAWLFDARFLSDVDLGASGIRGNRVPYAPEHQLDLAAGVALTPRLEVEVGMNYLDGQFANASNVRAASPDGMVGWIEARTLWRVSVNYRPQGEALRFHVSAQNLLNRTYVSSRVDGLFAGAPRVVTAGFEARF